MVLFPKTHLCKGGTDISRGATPWVSALLTRMSMQSPKAGGLAKRSCRGGGRCWGGGMRASPPYSCHLLLRAKKDSAEAAGACWPASRTVFEGIAHLRTHCACFAKAALITAALLPSSCPNSDKGWLASPLHSSACLRLTTDGEIQTHTQKKKWFGLVWFFFSDLDRK